VIYAVFLSCFIVLLKYIIMKALDGFLVT